MATTRRPGRKYNARHMDSFVSNRKEVDRLLEIHAGIAGTGQGRKHRVEVLNKSGIVLLVACWEAYIEDLATATFDLMLKNAKTHQTFSMKVLAKAAKELKDDKDERLIWNLAGDGWRSVLRDHRGEILQRYAGQLNTPRPDQIDELFGSLVGMTHLSRSWSWPHISADRAARKLNDLVTLRGAIAHRVTAAKAVHKEDVAQYAKFVNMLAVVTHNAVLRFVEGRLGFAPWHEYTLA